VGVGRVKRQQLNDAAVFLDRDGVIVELIWDDEDGAYEGPNRSADVQLMATAADALRRIRSLDYRTVVVSNQPGAAKGKASREDLRDVHLRVVELLAQHDAAIDDYRYCLHHPHGTDPLLTRDCSCRKPTPGMLRDAAAELALDLSRSWMIGDSDVDVAAGRSAGCTTILVENPRSAHRRSGRSADYVVDSLDEAVEIVASGVR